mmetsp:Transcript_22497/g.52313  ORF Transcript_22497/g.52313 Transcript_22497/m.52313 type:complete len:701 (-) Transcript_22497:25-2127(-)
MAGSLLLSLIAGLCLGQAVSVKVSMSSALQRDTSMSLKERPVMKVVRLLQDMKAELENELADDKAVHEKLSCWCSNNEKEKSEAIELANSRIGQLESSMDETTAHIAELKAKRASTMEELQNDHAALKKASALRIKEAKEFHEQELYLLDAIDACKQAIVVLSKHHPELAQLKSVAKVLQQAKVADLLEHTGSSTAKVSLQALKEFLDNVQGASSFLAVPGFQSYRPQSGQIFGILKQMQSDFEEDLSVAQEAEAKAKADFEALKAAKEDEIKLGDKTIAQIDEDYANAEEKYAMDAKELQNVQDQLGLDTEFLKNLKEKCAMSSEEFDKRVKDRLEEIAAVEDTIKILNADEAFDNFDKTVNAAFVQISATSNHAAEMKMRQRAVAVLQNAAAKSTDPKLALLAGSAKLDAFTKVKEVIDKLVAELSKQQADEVVHKDWCTDELGVNERSTAAANDKKADLETKMADLEQTMSKLTEDIKAEQESIAEMKKQMSRAGDVREAENADFSQTVADQRITQSILKKAIARMKEVYSMIQSDSDDEPQPGANHIQTSGTHTDPGNGPARFSEYNQNSGGGRVIRMLDKVLTDSQTMEDEAVAAEQEAQSVYESFMKDSNKAITKSQESIADMSKAKASAEQTMVMSKTDHKATMTDLEGLSKTLADLHQSCDFLLQNFDARQEARAAEMDALKEAKAILSGAQ